MRTGSSEDWERSAPRLYAGLVTFRRQHRLRENLSAILDQTQGIAALYVVDNEASEETRRIVAEVQSEHQDVSITYIPSSENIGPGGGWAMAMRCVLPEASDADWFLALDDDDPPQARDDVERVFSLAVEQRRTNDSVAGVGILGARFNWKSGLLQRIPDDELWRVRQDRRARLVTWVRERMRLQLEKRGASSAHARAMRGGPGSMTTISSIHGL